MELAGSYTFDAPREVVWKALMDPEILARILPGCERLERVAENEFKGTLNVRVGPVQGRFSGTVTLSDLAEPERFHMDVDGRGAAGFVRGGGEATLQEVDGKTVLEYSGEAQVGGRIASVGQRLLDTTARSITRQGLESLDRIIQAGMQPQPVSQPRAAEPEAASAPPPIPEIQPPSELELALGVLRDIFEEYVPEEQRPFVKGVMATLAVVFVLWLLGRLGRRD